MKALRLVLHQNSANYKKEETVENKMTYPLPPISTVIGALHNACGYRAYHPMDVSIQGRYESMHREAYTDHCFLNSLQDDRGILVKMKNADLLSNGFDMVASAKKNQGNSFRKGITIQVHNQALLDEYRYLKDVNDEIDAFKKVRLDPLLARIKSRKKHLAEKKKSLTKGSEEYTRIANREAEIKALEKKITQGIKDCKREKYEEPIAYFRSLTKSLKYYEVLDGIELIIHIRAEDDVIQDLYEHAYDIKSIGRSEDTVYVEDTKIVELAEEMDSEEVISPYSAYLDYDAVLQKDFYLMTETRGVSGTKYYLNKKYEVINGKRIFEKKKVIYTSNYAVEELGNGVFLDNEGQYKDRPLIVNFL